MKVRPKRTLLYGVSSLDGGSDIYISCYPQQRWDARIFHHRDQVRLLRQNISLCIPLEDFEKNWITVEEKK